MKLNDFSNEYIFYSSRFLHALIQKSIFLLHLAVKNVRFESYTEFYLLEKITKALSRKHL